MKVIVFDFEVFKYDTLLGAYIVGEDKYVQLWSPAKIREFYYENYNAVWVH